MQNQVQSQKLRKLSIGGDVAYFQECHDQSEPTVNKRFRVHFYFFFIKRCKFGLSLEDNIKLTFYQIRTRLITMRSKPNYVEFVLLQLLLMLLLWFLLLYLVIRDYLWLIKAYLILIEGIIVVELASRPCLDLAFTLPNPLLDLARNLP